MNMMNNGTYGTIPAWLLLVGLALRGASAGGAGEYEPFVYTNASGQTIPYRLLKPDSIKTGKKYPLVLFFHGAGERGTNNLSQLKHGAPLFARPENQAGFPCFVLAPQCPENQQWVDMPWGADSGTRPVNPSAAMQLALEALDRVMAQNPIDTNRLYVTGLSMGGYGVWDCLTRFPGRFAAGAPVCGGGDDKTVTAAVAKVPLWTFHSDDDPVVKVIRTRAMVKAMKDAGGNPKYFEYSGLKHDAWTTAFNEPEYLPWLFSQRLGRRDTYVLKAKAPQRPPAATSSSGR
jgi:predicted peptidase